MKRLSAKHLPAPEGWIILDEGTRKHFKERGWKAGWGTLVWMLPLYHFPQAIREKIYREENKE